MHGPPESATGNSQKYYQFDALYVHRMPDERLVPTERPLTSPGHLSATSLATTRFPGMKVSRQVYRASATEGWLQCRMCTRIWCRRPVNMRMIVMHNVPSSKSVNPAMCASTTTCVCDGLPLSLILFRWDGSGATSTRATTSTKVVRTRPRHTTMYSRRSFCVSNCNRRQ